MPDWVYHYENEEKRCGVGFASSHIRGIAYQRALAISRAIDEIAKQIKEYELKKAKADLENIKNGNGKLKKTDKEKKENSETEDSVKQNDDENKSDKLDDKLLDKILTDKKEKESDKN